MNRAQSSLKAKSTRLVSPRTQLVLLFTLNLVTLIGTALAVSLTQHFYDIRNGTAGFKSFCNIGQALNCDLIAASPYAEFILGLPLSSFAAGWILGLFVISVIAHNVYWRREALRILLAMSFTGTLIGLFYLFIMVVRLKTYCLMCIGVDVANILALGLVVALSPEGFKVHRLDRAKWKVMLPTTFVAILAMVWILKSMDQFSMKDSDLNELVSAVMNTPEMTFKISDEFPAFGPKNAPITIIEFSDFQCPYCRIGAFALNSVINRYPQQIRVIFRSFPLDAACNPQVQQTPHPNACEAAKVAYCAHKLGDFEPVYQELFDKQSSFATGVPTALATQAGMQAGIKESELKLCVNSLEPTLAINQDIHDASEHGVQSTPTFFINGHKMLGAYPVYAWIKIIDLLIEKSKAPAK